MSSTSEWVRGAYAAVDGLDADAFVQYLAPDAWLRFGNAPPVQGREGVRAALSEFFAGVRGMRHDFTARWDGPEGTVLEADVTYTRADGSRVTLPVATAVRLRDGLASRVQIFMDVSPVFQAEVPRLCRADATAIDETPDGSVPAGDAPAWSGAHAGAPLHG